MVNTYKGVHMETDYIKGVNLGNWLVLEKWMKPDLFASSGTEDETWLCRKEKPDALRALLKEHRDTYITEDDFAYVASLGLNYVRLPVPYFVFGDREPFVGCIEYVDRAFDWAEKHGIQILLDLHTVPHSQNGYDNGGITGVCKWCHYPDEVEFALTVLERLSERYGKRRGLYGIEVLNEPISWIVYITAPSTGKAVDKEEAKGVSFQRNIVLCSDGTPLGGKSLEEYVYTKDDNSYYYNANYALKYDNEEIKPNTNVYTIGFYESMSGKELEFAKRFMKDLSTNGSVVVDNGDDLVDAFENTASTIITVDTPDTPDKPDSQVITTGSESSSNTSSNSSSSSSSTGGSSNNKSGNTANSTPAASAQTVTSDTVSTGDSSVSFALVLSVSLIAFAVIVFTARKKEAE